MSGTQTMKPRMQEHYETTVKPNLMEQFGYKNAMEVPRLEKIVVNMGVGAGVLAGVLMTTCEDGVVRLWCETDVRDRKSVV